MGDTLHLSPQHWRVDSLSDVGHPRHGACFDDWYPVRLGERVQEDFYAQTASEIS